MAVPLLLAPAILIEAEAIAAAATATLYAAAGITTGATVCVAALPYLEYLKLSTLATWWGAATTAAAPLAVSGTTTATGAVAAAGVTAGTGAATAVGVTAAAISAPLLLGSLGLASATCGIIYLAANGASTAAAGGASAASAGSAASVGALRPFNWSQHAWFPTKGISDLFRSEGREIYKSLTKLTPERLGTIWKNKNFRIDAGGVLKGEGCPNVKSWNLQVNRNPESTLAKNLLRKTSTHERLIWGNWDMTNPQSYEAWMAEVLQTFRR